jgi:hypothetical protein
VLGYGPEATTLDTEVLELLEDCRRWRDEREAR